MSKYRYGGGGDPIHVGGVGPATQEYKGFSVTTEITVILLQGLWGSLISAAIGTAAGYLLVSAGAGVVSTVGVALAFWMVAAITYRLFGLPPRLILAIVPLVLVVAWGWLWQILADLGLSEAEWYERILYGFELLGWEGPVFFGLLTTWRFAKEIGEHDFAGTKRHVTEEKVRLVQPVTRPIVINGSRGPAMPAVTEAEPELEQSYVVDKEQLARLDFYHFLCLAVERGPTRSKLVLPKPDTLALATGVMLRRGAYDRFVAQAVEAGFLVSGGDGVPTTWAAEYADNPAAILPEVARWAGIPGRQAGGRPGGQGRPPQEPGGESEGG